MVRRGHPAPRHTQGSGTYHQQLVTQAQYFVRCPRTLIRRLRTSVRGRRISVRGRQTKSRLGHPRLADYS